MISYWKYNYDKSFLFEKATIYRNVNLAICIYEHDELLKMVELIDNKRKGKTKGKLYRNKEVGSIRVELCRLNKRIRRLEEYGVL